MKLSEWKEKMGTPRFYLAVLLTLATTFYLGYVCGNWYHAERQAAMLQMQQTMSNLSEENAKLNRQLNVANVQLEVAKLTNQQTRETLQASTARNSELQRELGFYQRVMAPEQTLEGFVIEALELHPTLVPDHYRYSLALLQQAKHKAVVKGNINIRVSGMQGGKASHYELAALMPEGEKPADSFSFRYFEMLEGVIKLPQGFIPERVTVEAEIFRFKKKRGDLVRTFEWQQQLGSGDEQVVGE